MNGQPKGEPAFWLLLYMQDQIVERCVAKQEAAEHSLERHNYDQRSFRENVALNLQLGDATSALAIQKCENGVTMTICKEEREQNRYEKRSCPARVG